MRSRRRAACRTRRLHLPAKAGGWLPLGHSANGARSGVMRVCRVLRSCARGALHASTARVGFNRAVPCPRVTGGLNSLTGADRPVVAAHISVEFYVADLHANVAVGNVLEDFRRISPLRRFRARRWARA